MIKVISTKFLHCSRKTKDGYFYTILHYSSREPKGDILIRFARILNTSIDYLLGNFDSPYTEQLREESKQAQYRAVLSDKDLPPEAVKEIEDFVRYIEYKYKK